MTLQVLCLQGAVAEIFLKSSDLISDARGMASLVKIHSLFDAKRNGSFSQHCFALIQAGVLPPFVPFAQAFAAVITAALTGSLYYMAASPKGS